MDIEEFRKHGKETIDWICDYYKNIEKYPVRSQEEPGYLRKLLPSEAPFEGEKYEDIMKDVNTKILKGMTHWQSPTNFGFYPVTSSYAGIIGELLSTGFNVLGFSWVCSPACTELETIVVDWMAKIQKLPEFYLSSGTGGGVIQGSGSECILVAILAARKREEMKQTKKKNEEGNYMSRFVAYVSEHTHSSAQKGCNVAGIRNLRIIETNEDFEMDLEKLEQEIEKDLRLKNIPFFVCATIGTTSSSSNDNIDLIGDICNKYDIWMHVDAAYAGSFMIVPEFRNKYFKGIEKSWSYNFNPYKMMLTNFDCSLLYVRDRKPLINALSITPEYLRSKEYENNLVFDYRDWQVPLARRFRALKLWFVIRNYGVKGLQEHILEKAMIARELTKLVEKDERFEVIGKTNFSLVCFRLVGDNDENNEMLLEKINKDGRLFLVQTKLNGKFVLRLAIGARLTKLEHVIKSWKVIQELATVVLNSKQ